VTALHNGKPAGVGGQPVGYGYFGIINLPNDNVIPYQVQINAPGYTAGPVTVESVLLDDCGGGFPSWCTNRFPGEIGLPPNIPGRHHIVTNWQSGSLETDLFTPTAGPIQCEVGIAQISSLYCFLGSLTSAPFARLLHHGANGDPTFWGFGDDLVSIKGPLYPTSPGVPYEIFLNTLGTFNLPNQGAVTRIWTGGKIVGTFEASQGDSTTNGCTYSGGSTPCDLLYVGDLSQAGVFTPKGIYGTSSAAGSPGVLPYTAVRTTPINRSPR
jgi:hypothetical protein